MERRQFLVSLAALAAQSGISAAWAADWPQRPLRMVVSYPPGGSTDIAGRLLAAPLGTALGQQIVVDNRAGAGGTLGANNVVRAEPDGYTLLLGASPEISLVPVTMKNAPYDPGTDLMPISLVGQVPFLLVVNPRLPVQNLQEFLAYARANPGKLNYSSFGNNTSNHLNGELFKSLGKFEAVHVPYKGSGPSIADLIGGQVQYTLDGPPAVLEHVRAGKLRALAVASAQRLPAAPSVPTFAEAGLPNFVAGTWFGLLAPARTPSTVIARLNREVVAALASPELSKAFMDRNIIPSGNSPEAFERFIRAEIDKWKRLAPTLGISAE
ncbi:MULTISPECIES: Bug family tripartite tricarboxylate transporter substrate binding protein [unclassified Cupriavidus]|uniref:Bug family tripartite tricarboxylate transporter substrate binding protein n=1 Tax=Cupriavidus sp. H19C3 TaxID=3241603 RepID=UPI003BF90677